MHIQRYAKSCCYKTNYVDDPKPLIGTHSCACMYIAPRRMDYCTQEAVLCQRVLFLRYNPLVNGHECVLAQLVSTTLRLFTNNNG